MTMMLPGSTAPSLGAKSECYTGRDDTAFTGPVAREMEPAPALAHGSCSPGLESVSARVGRNRGNSQEPTAVFSVC